MNYSSVGINRHRILNGLAQEDPTYENWLRLAETIFSGQIRLSDLYDKEESLKRMKEIDELRARGEKTEYETLYAGSEMGRGTPLEVKNCRTKEVKKFTSIKKACDEYNIPSHKIVNAFLKAGTNKILYHGLIFKKIKEYTPKSKIKDNRQYYDAELHNRYNTKIEEWEKAFIVQNRPEMKWRDIGLILGRTPEGLGNILRTIKKKGNLEYYRNMDISDREELGA